MIFDSLTRLSQALPQTVWTEIEPFLKLLNAETPDGEYLLRKNELFARVMSYETRSQNEGRIEAHDQYVDIQSVLVGAEKIDVFPTEILEAETDYDEKKDVRFYKPYGVTFAQFEVYPGYFALFFPQDAHRPQMMLGDTKQKVKKIVIKIKLDSLR